MKMRIFFFNRFFWPDQSATAQILTDLCRELDNKGYQITVVSSRLDYSNKKIQYQKSEKLGTVEIVRLWSTRFGRGMLIGRLFDYLTIYYSFFAYILRNLGSQDIVVLKTDPPLLSILGALGREVRQFRLVAWCQDVFPEVAIEEVQPFLLTKGLFRMLKLIRDWSLHRSDRVIVLGKDMRDYFANREIAPRNLVVIHNWSVQEDVAYTKENQLREAWGISADTFVVGYSGNLGRAHDWTTILETADCFKSSDRILFLICGGGFGYSMLQQEVSKRALNSLFKFLPYQPRDELASSLRVPDLHWISLKASLTPFIFPSKFFGILQAGRPLVFIGKEDCEIARTITNTGIGRVVSENAYQKFRDYILECTSNRFDVLKTGIRVRKLWESNYCSTVEIEKWDKLLEELQYG